MAILKVAQMGHPVLRQVAAAIHTDHILSDPVQALIADMRDTSLAQIREVMEINVYANKRLLDWLAGRDAPPQQVVLVSSGAGIKGNRGWGAYALAKATLNMLAQLYAAEMTSTHVCALAPGLIDTAMQVTLREKDPKQFPSLERLHGAQGTDAMPEPRVAAEKIAAFVPHLTSKPSGAFVDIRDAPPT